MLEVLNKIYVGPAGIPLTSKKQSTPEGVKRVAELGLDAMEIEFVRGVRMSAEVASETRYVSRELGVVLTVHAPYYVNLLSEDPAKVEASIKRVLDSARVGYLAGAWSVAFHPGYYGKLNSEKAVEVVRKHLINIVKELINEGIKIWVRPETMGGLAEVGSLEEVISIVEGVELSLPVVDFAHIYARSLGKVNSYEEYVRILSLIEERLGREALNNMHIHMSGIEYGVRGEKKHLNLKESRFNWVEVLKALKDFKIAGVIICESPSLEYDALIIKEKINALST
ncbi:MAG: hypothetical protein B7O98_07265 [Zestosphaera tikiterensis]|uniref:Xylose isomerase-like TIM barrel domain-containing protein n=1 Tax=Zestosphaera tikiterensis TaxID=1973259 RepID=A0A2R7Y4K5_9CREN|nr:MAG: hypothetical protein B7O98_07265 [Zestosphaera tikiterensis]